MRVGQDGGWLCVVTLAGLFAMLNTGCTDLECGEGTEQRGGQCVPPDDGTRDPATCGPGTTYDPTRLECLPELPPAACDPDTTIEVVDDDGVTQCVGVGSGPHCLNTCKNPDPGNVTLCGRLHDAERAEAFPTGPGLLCDPEVENGLKGCVAQLTFFDAESFAASPSGASPLVPQELVIDSCGSYMAHNIPLPTSGQIAMLIDDHPATGEDLWARSVHIVEAVSGQRLTGLQPFVLAHTTDAVWTAVADEPFGSMSMAEHGVNLIVFNRARDWPRPVPVAEVALAATDVMYFADAAPNRITLPTTTLDATGANGAALVVLGSFGSVSASGGEPWDETPGQAGVRCVWPDGPGGVIPGVFLGGFRSADNSVTGEDCQ